MPLLKAILFSLQDCTVQNIFNAPNYQVSPKSEKDMRVTGEKIKKEFTNIDLILSPAMGGIIIGYEIDEY